MSAPGEGEAKCPPESSCTAVRGGLPISMRCRSARREIWELKEVLDKLVSPALVCLVPPSRSRGGVS